MTTQEFVKKEKDKIVNEVFHPATDYSESKLLAKQEFGNGIITGLTKGLEIAKGALKYARENAVNGNDGCWDFNTHDQILQSLTDDELLTIFLTEKYGK